MQHRRRATVAAAVTAALMVCALAVPTFYLAHLAAAGRGLVCAALLWPLYLLAAAFVALKVRDRL